MNPKRNPPSYNYDNLYGNIKNYDKIQDTKMKNDISRLLDVRANDVSLRFFSEDNVKKLNNIIIGDILNLTREKYKQPVRIKPQQREKMITVMRYVYYEYATNTYELNVEVQRLNEKFLELVVPTIYNELIAYLNYIETYDRTKNIPINNPISTKQKADLKSFSSLFGF